MTYDLAYRRLRFGRIPLQCRARGFSLTELVAVMVIIGALAVFVAPRVGLSEFERYAFRNELLAALRYAQKTAMASGCQVGVQLNAGTDTYRVVVRSGAAASIECGTGPFDESLRHPANGGDYTHTASGGAGLSVSGIVTFDGFGAYRSGPTSIALAGGAVLQVDDVTGYVRD